MRCVDCGGSGILIQFNWTRLFTVFEYLTCNRNKFGPRILEKLKKPCVIFQSPNIENVINTKYLAHKNIPVNSWSSDLQDHSS